jgi:hypothetical protein
LLFAKESAMSTVFSPSPASLGVATPTAPFTARRFDGTRSLAALLLAAAVAALVVLADQLIDTWADGHLFLGWVALWVVIFAGFALFAGATRRAARSTLAALDGWSRTLAEARAEARLWEMARLDPRLKAELIQARARAAEAAAPVAVEAAHDYTRALAPLGMDADGHSPALLRRMAQTEMRRHAGYLPYI